MTRKKPCSICRRWFLPDARTRHCQRTCGDAACRAEQRRRTQQHYYKHNRAYWAERRLRGQVQAAEQRPAASVVPPPPKILGDIPWELVQDAFGVQGGVLLGFFVRLQLRAVQDAMRAQRIETTKEIVGVPPKARQDATDVVSGFG